MLPCVDCNWPCPVLNSVFIFIQMLSICDVVLNHTANESEWLIENPQCAYNLLNSQHLRPAYILDRLLFKFSLDVSVGDFENCGLPPSINCEDHLNVRIFDFSNL